ncbi:MAG: RNA methyltransferase [Myxococcota bacterium]
MIDPALETRVETIAPAVLAEINAALMPLLTAERQARLEAALATRTRDLTVVLEDVANEHNGAAVLRTAEAFGFFEVHVIEPDTGRFKISRRISKGTDKWLDLHKHSETTAAYATLRARGYKIWASTLHGKAVDVHEIPVEGKVALVFGNELSGLSQTAIAGADGYFRVPMQGFVESFNISVAAAISCYDLSLRRRASGRPVGLEPEDAGRVRAVWLTRAAKSGPQVLQQKGLPIPGFQGHRFAPGAADLEDPTDEGAGP